MLTQLQLVLTNDASWRELIQQAEKASEVIFTLIAFAFILSTDYLGCDGEVLSEVFGEVFN